MKTIVACSRNFLNLHSLLYTVESLDISFSMFHTLWCYHDDSKNLQVIYIVQCTPGLQQYTLPTQHSEALGMNALQNVRIIYNLIHSFNWCKYRPLHLLCIIWMKNFCFHFWNRLCRVCFRSLYFSFHFCSCSSLSAIVSTRLTN